MHKIIKISRINPTVAGVLLVLTGYSYNAYATTASGTVISTTGPLAAVQAGKTRSLSRGSNFFISDTLRTGANATARLRFTDGTLLSLRPSSSIRVNSYAYNKKAPNASNSRFNVNLIQGGLRNVTGQIAKIAPNNYKTESRVATIGVRGTDFGIAYDMKGGLYAGVSQGAIQVSNQAGDIVLANSRRYQYAYVADKNTAPVGLANPPALLQPDLITTPTAVPATGRGFAVGVGYSIATPTSLGTAVQNAYREPTSSLATTVAPPITATTAPLSSGFYAGVGIGTDIVKNDIAYTFTIMPACSLLCTGGPLQLTSFNWGAQGFKADLFGGYSFPVNNRFSLSFEAEGSWNTESSNYSVDTLLVNAVSPTLTTVTDNRSSARIKMKNSWGISVAPAVSLTNSLQIFARLGLVYGNFNLDTAFLKGNATTFVQNNIFTGFPEIITIHTTKPGINAGLGFESFITPRLSIRGEYDWQRFSNITRSVPNPGMVVLTGNGIGLNEITIRPTINTVTLAGIYHFYNALPNTMVPIFCLADGFYAGLGFSGDFSQYSINGNVVQQLSDENTTINKHVNLNGNGLNSSLYLGYARNLSDRFRLAAEIFGSLSTASGVFNTQDGFATTLPGLFQTARIRLRNSFGVSILPGVNLSPSTSLFTRVGLINSSFRFFDHTSIAPEGLDPGTFFGFFDGFAINNTSRKNGLELGLGIESMLLPHAGVRIEYDWARYSKIILNQSFVSSFTNNSGQVSIRPTLNELNVVFIYHFRPA